MTQNPAPRKQPNPGRLTVVEHWYYQSAGHPAVQLSAKFEVPADGGEPAYSRPGIQLGPDWVPLDLGWLAGKVGPKALAAAVIVQNTDRTPGRDLELAFRPDPDPGEVMLVGPGESVRLRPADPAKLVLRSRAGMCSARTTVLPLG